MAVVQIPNLSAAIALNGTEQFEAVQAGVSVRVTALQLGTYFSTSYSTQLGNSYVAGALVATGYVTLPGTPYKILVST